MAGDCTWLHRNAYVYARNKLRTRLHPIRHLSGIQEANTPEEVRCQIQRTDTYRSIARANGTF
jgi:hypothetical protein